MLLVFFFNYKPHFNQCAFLSTNRMYMIYRCCSVTEFRIFLRFAKKQCCKIHLRVSKYIYTRHVQLQIFGILRTSFWVGLIYHPSLTKQIFLLRNISMRATIIVVLGKFVYLDTATELFSYSARRIRKMHYVFYMITY